MAENVPFPADVRAGNRRPLMSWECIVAWFCIPAYTLADPRFLKAVPLTVADALVNGTRLLAELALSEPFVTVAPASRIPEHLPALIVQGVLGALGIGFAISGLRRSMWPGRIISVSGLAYFVWISSRWFERLG
jgi:hypothetical protein